MADTFDGDRTEVGFFLVSTTVGVKDLYPPAELMHRTGTFASVSSFLVSRPKRSSRRVIAIFGP
jgi:hypothetical protein